LALKEAGIRLLPKSVSPHSMAASRLFGYPVEFGGAPEAGKQLKKCAKELRLSA
jgi:hypothetical protein